MYTDCSAALFLDFIALIISHYMQMKIYDLLVN